MPAGVEHFISQIIERFECFWLTTHCKGNPITAINYLKEFYPIEIIENLKIIKPTNWDTLKTEAINFNKNFVWLDDNPFEAEKRVLKQHE